MKIDINGKDIFAYWVVGKDDKLKVAIDKNTNDYKTICEQIGKTNEYQIKYDYNIGMFCITTEDFIDLIRQVSNNEIRNICINFSKTIDRH